MCTYVYLMKVLKSLLTLTCLNQARFKKKSITSKIRYGSAKKGERLARALFISLVKSSFGGRVGVACWVRLIERKDGGQPCMVLLDPVSEGQLN